MITFERESTDFVRIPVWDVRTDPPTRVTEGLEIAVLRPVAGEALRPGTNDWVEIETNDGDTGYLVTPQDQPGVLIFWVRITANPEIVVEKIGSVRKL